MPVRTKNLLIRCMLYIFMTVSGRFLGLRMHCPQAPLPLSRNSTTYGSYQGQINITKQLNNAIKVHHQTSNPKLNAVKSCTRIHKNMRSSRGSNGNPIYTLIHEKIKPFFDGSSGID